MPASRRPLSLPASRRPLSLPASQRPLSVPASRRPLSVPASRRPLSVPASRRPLSVSASRNRTYGSPEERALWHPRAPRHKGDDIRTRSSPEDGSGVVEDETVGALAGRSGVAMSKRQQVRAKKSTLWGGCKADSCKADSCKRRLQRLNYACAIDHMQQGRPEIVERTRATSGGWH